ACSAWRKTSSGSTSHPSLVRDRDGGGAHHAFRLSCAQLRSKCNPATPLERNVGVRVRSSLDFFIGDCRPYFLHVARRRAAPHRPPNSPKEIPHAHERFRLVSVP